MANKIIVIKCDMSKNLRIIHVPHSYCHATKKFDQGSINFVPTEERHAPLVVTDTDRASQVDVEASGRNVRGTSPDTGSSTSHRTPVSQRRATQ